jgi:hypothetical protein
VYSASDQDHGLALFNQLRCFAIAFGGWAELARIGELVLDLPELFKTREICGRADGSHHEGLAHRRVTQRLKNDAVAGAVELPEIVDYLIPRSEFAILTRREAENFRGRRNLFLGGGYSRHEKEQQQCDYSCSHWFLAV